MITCPPQDVLPYHRYHHSITIVMITVIVVVESLRLPVAWSCQWFGGSLHGQRFSKTWPCSPLRWFSSSPDLGLRWGTGESCDGWLHNHITRSQGDRDLVSYWQGCVELAVVNRAPQRTGLVQGRHLCATGLAAGTAKDEDVRQGGVTPSSALCVEGAPLLRRWCSAGYDTLLLKCHCCPVRAGYVY